MKYYTPEISEFFVGFEFERKDLLHKNKWVKSIFLDGESAEQYCNEDNLGRIKYLDKEDIESLGFKHLGGLWFRKDSCLTENGKNFLSCVLRKWSNTELDIYSLDTNYDTDTLIFRGNIKNKSEFRKVLQMLNIQ